MKKLWLLFFLSYSCSLFAQQGYTTGEQIMDFPIRRVLNSSKQKAAVLSELRKEITILDFFGTWCAPCLRALPALSALQNQFTDKLSVVLISTEEPEQLVNFIKARSPFLFPVIVDINESITNRFRPPSYPYTVVLDADGKILAITEAGLITNEKIKNWLDQTSKKTEQKPEFTVTLSDHQSKSADSIKSIPAMQDTAMENKNGVLELSRQFIYAAKTGNETHELITRIAQIDFDSLKNGLASDNDKKAFWINLYNGFTQVRLKKNPEKYKSRGSFFSEKEITVAGKLFSLDMIEHGILRHSKIKWSLGYLNKWFPSKVEKILRVNQLDYRIHFALNCGAKSCPPIASYNTTELDKQLDLATKAYLTGEAVYDSTDNSVALPTLMSWFRRDFHGKKQMIALLKKWQIIPEDRNPSISFKKYDWSLYLDNYKK